MHGFAQIAALVVAVANLLTGAVGAWLWWRVEPAQWWWPLLRASQVLCGLFALAAGVLGATPLFAWLGRRLPRRDSFQLALVDCGKLATLVAIAVASAMRLSSGTYNPFIYFRF